MVEETKDEEEELVVVDGRKKTEQLEEIKEVEAAVDQDLFAGENTGAEEDIDFDWRNYYAPIRNF